MTSPTADLSNHDLETELLGLAAHLAAAQCRFLQLLAEFDSRGGWSGPGLRSCAHWLSWRIGMSLRTATEHLRVAHALTELPAITEAFAAGRISYSKVRAITRIAVRSDTDSSDTDSSDPTSADPASADPASVDPASVDPAGVDPAGVDPAGVDPAGVDPTDADPLKPEPPSPDRPNHDQQQRAPHQQAPQLAADAEQVLLDLALAGTASHVETVVRATRRSQADPSRTAALRSLSWHRDDDGSLVLRGRFTADEGALLIATIESLVPRRQPIAHPVPEPPEGWRATGTERAPGAVDDRIAARRADVLLALVTGTANQDGPVVARGTTQVVVHVEASSGAARIEGGPDIPTSTAERMACDAQAQVLLHDRQRNRLYLGRNRRLATPAQIAALTVRDGSRCRFPGCSHTHHLHAHHVRHWLVGGRTDLDNLVLLCSFHHRLIHDRGYRVRAEQGDWVFHRPDGGLVPEAGAPLDGNTESMLEMNTRAELRLTRDSLTPTWGGEPLDPTPILERLLPRPNLAAA